MGKKRKQLARDQPPAAEGSRSQFLRIKRTREPLDATKSEGSRSRFSPIEGQFLDAINADDIVAILSCLDEDTDSNLFGSCQDPLEFLPLACAAWCGYKNVVVELLNRGADVNTKACGGSTPLYLAVHQNQTGIVAELLERNANTEIPEQHGETPLWRAVANRYDDCVGLLLEKGANVNTQNREGVSVIHQAVKNNDLETLRKVCSVPPIPIQWGSAFSRLCDTRDQAGESPLLTAVINRSQEIVRLLLSEGANLGAIDLESDMELARSIYDGSEEITELLIERIKSDVKQRGYYKDLNHKNCTGMTAFLWAAYKDNKSIGKTLLDCGADISAADEDGMTALHFTAERGYADFIGLLLNADSERRASFGSMFQNNRQTLDISAKESRGHTPLLLALNTPWYREHYRESESVVVQLLRHGADPSAKNNNQQNALHLAVLQEFTGVIPKLLSGLSMDDVFAKDVEGNTALHFACQAETRSAELVGLLLERDDLPKNALSLENKKGETALTLAVKKRATGVIQALVNHGYDVGYGNKLGKELPVIKQSSQQQLVFIEEVLQENERRWSALDRLNTLKWSARNGRKSLVRKLLSVQYAPSDETVFDALYWASIGGQTRIVSWLLQDYGEVMSVNVVRSDILQAAAANGHETIVGDLIKTLIRFDEERFSLGKHDGGGFRYINLEFGNTAMSTTEWTPLHWAVIYKPKVATEIVHHMLMNGADPEVRNGGISAREMATYLGREHGMRVLLQAPLRVAREPPQLEEPFISAGTGAEEACKRSPANIIDFCMLSGSNCTLESKSTVYDLVYRQKSGPGTVMQQARDAWSLDGTSLKYHFRWIHLPANNWTWAEDLTKRIYSESTKNKKEYPRVRSFMEAYRREHNGKPFCRFMYPALSFERREFMSAEDDAISKLQRNMSSTQLPRGEDTDNQQESSTIAALDQVPDQVPRKTEKVRHRVINKELNRKSREPAEVDWGRRFRIAPVPKLAEPHLWSGETRHTNIKQESAKEVKASTSDHTGIKMSIYVPFITFHSVSGHRALRRTVRLTEEVKKIHTKERARLVSPTTTDEIPISQEERRTAERVRNDVVRKMILDTEVKTGLKLLKSTKTNLYEYFSERWNRIRSSPQEEKLRSLRVIHRAMTRNIESNIPGIMEWLERLSDAILLSTGSLSESEDPKYELLLENYLNPQEETGLHPTRTLDQYYYSALSDTSRRDVDQVVRRYQARISADQFRLEAERAVISNEQDEIHDVDTITKAKKSGKRKADDENDLTQHWEDDPDAQICMVDQLWLWVLDDETIVTCFPPSSGSQSMNKGELDLLDRIREHIQDDTRPHVSSVYQLATLITSLCVRFVEECQLPSKDSLLHTFASSIGTVADEEVKCFENFRRDISHARLSQTKAKKQPTSDADSYREKVQREIQERLEKLYHERYPDSKMEDLQAEIGRLEAIQASGGEMDIVEVDIQKEIMLLEEIKDIRDELNILKSIFEDQKSLLNKLFALVRESHLKGRETTQTDAVVDYYQERSDINLRLEKTNKMEMDAKITYDSINHLLDLKQKNANLFEAVQARKQAEQSAQQGRTILVFTVVTIIFLPLSFLSSFYSLKIDTFPRLGDDSFFPTEWIMPRIFGTSAALAIPLIILAIFVNDILKYYRKYLQQRITSIWIGFKGILTFKPERNSSKSQAKKERWGSSLLVSRNKERLPTIEDGENR